MSLIVLDEVSFDGLSERSFVQVVTKQNKSLIRAVTKVEPDKLTVIDIETQKEQTFDKSMLKSIRRDVPERTVAENVGIGPWTAWQLAPQFKEATKRQTVASIQQAAVFVTVNQYSGLVVGDSVDVFRLGDPITDPTTGEVLDTPERKIAKLEVIALSERLMTCRPTGEFVIELAVGDVVRPSQPRASVAVLPFTTAGGVPSESGVGVSEATTNALVSLGVPTLERARTAEIMGEQLRQLSPVFDGGDASRVGKLLGAATIVSGRISAAPGNRRTAIVSIRLLDVRTGEILKSVDVEMSASKLKLSGTSSAAAPIAAPIMNRDANGRNDALQNQVSENSIGMKFVLIPAGEFVMGSPETETGRLPSESQHTVTLTRPFEMGIYEVTQSEFQRVMNATPSDFVGERNPVEKVSWNTATDFCLTLSNLPEEKISGYKYRLPTEAEWEYACRAGTTTVHHFGNDSSQMSNYAWFDRNSGGTTHPVGQKQPNGWGLFDMHGNVWEWCQDYDDDLPSHSETDPTGPARGMKRVVRGGGWYYKATQLRSAYRGADPPEYEGNFLGFRLVREK